MPPLVMYYVNAQASLSLDSGMSVTGGFHAFQNHTFWRLGSRLRTDF